MVYSSLFAVEVTTRAVATIATTFAVIATLAVALLLAHHHRRAFFMAVDADGHVADHVFVDLRLALQLGHDVARRVDFEHHVVRLAVLGDLVRQAAQTPILGLDDRALVILDDLGGGGRRRGRRRRGRGRAS